MDKKEVEDFENQIVDVDEIEGTDIKITPAYYIHLALIACQKSMQVDNIQERIYGYRMAVDHMESVCVAASLLDDEYDKEVKKLIDSKEYQEADKEYHKTFMLAKLRFRELATRVFKNQLITSPLKS